MNQVVIIGGGISGLSTAYYLVKQGFRPVLIERRPQLGGVLTTEIVDGCLIEGGPDSFLAAKPWALELIRELGLAGELMGSNDHRRVTYIWKQGELIPLPDGLMLMVPTRILPMVGSRLLGWPTKLRMGLEFFRRYGSTDARDRSVADFVEDHYGREAVDYLAEPLLAGVYGGDPRQLSVASVLTRFVELSTRYGSLTRGVLAEMRKARTRQNGQQPAAPIFQTLKGGLGSLVEALRSATEGQVELRHAEAEALERHGEYYRVRIQGEWIQARQVVLACQAYEAAALVSGLHGELSELLRSIPYSSSMTVALGYLRSEIGHPLTGFGFLVPKVHRKRMVACTWVGTKFDHRVPPTHAVLRCFLGGWGEERVLQESDEAIIAAMREELRQIMGVTAQPVFVRIHRWPRSMAQYTVGHGERVARIEALRKGIAGLYLAGNAYYGIGVPDCVRMGKQVAAEIAAKRGQ